MTEKVKCPGCGAEVAPTGTCRFCGSTAFVDGVAGKLLPSDLKCPRCTDAPPLRGVEHEGFRADLCLKCHGVWFGLGILEEVIRTAAKRPPKRGEGAQGPIHGGVEPVRYARCPRCGGGMARVPCAQKPLVIVDRCPAHGDWCDGGELGQLKSVARTRGSADSAGGARKPEAAKAPAQPAPADAVDPLIAELRSRGGTWRLTPSGDRGTPSRRSFSLFSRRRHRRDLFDVLWDLLDL